MLIAGCVGVLLLSFVPPRVEANIGPQWWGDRAVVPLGLKGVAITRENLTIDLRPLASVQPVSVEATYHLHNAEPAKKPDLLFITGVSGVSDFEVLLNDRRIENRQVPTEEGTHRLPTNWDPPEYLPGLESDRTEGQTHLAPSAKIVLAFSIELLPGTSILRTRYRARATGTDEGYSTVTWLFPYILAPAREWASFGGLDVIVYLPETWQAASKPTLEREDNVLRGSFAHEPADCLALAIRAPVPSELDSRVRRYVILYLLALASGGLLCCWGGRMYRRYLPRKNTFHGRVKRFNSFERGVIALLFAISWAAMLVGVLLFAQNDLLKLLAGRESPYYCQRFFLPSCSRVILLPIPLLAAFCLAWGVSERSYTGKAENFLRH